MTNKHILFPQVKDHYADLVNQLETAQKNISMTYFSFDAGNWSEKIAKILIAKAGAGLKVRLMVDELGQITDDPRHVLPNQLMLNYLQTNGVQVDKFHPANPTLSFRNRLHFKITAIDDRTVFLGGSNIGGFYTTWNDTNLRVDGSLGDTFHKIYDFVRSFSRGNTESPPQLELSDQWVGDDQLWLTVPGQRNDIHKASLQLILNADKAIYLRTWYFIPDEEILSALCWQAQRGVRVNVMLSHRTRVRPIDFANYIHIHKLVCAGGHVYRYKGKYMHSKTTWNNRGEVLFGSANMDAHSMKINFESCLKMNDHKLASELRRAFIIDLQSCVVQTTETYPRRSKARKFLTHTCNLATPWL
ncbi:MAG: phospholipase D-like domain-containing protein [Anaerolineae bacterium]|nr:phospholipase D-like domain-containing protein [Anaerolineae bacterium]